MLGKVKELEQNDRDYDVLSSLIAQMDEEGAAAVCPKSFPALNELVAKMDRANRAALEAGDAVTFARDFLAWFEDEYGEDEIIAHDLGPGHEVGDCLICSARAIVERSGCVFTEESTFEARTGRSRAVPLYPMPGLPMARPDTEEEGNVT
jgi:hypothetical protein